MRAFVLLISAIALFSASAIAQYVPQAGLPGSSAIPVSSSLFAGWATQCIVQRGYMDIANPSLGYTSAGDSSLALGPADDVTVSLGDSGVAVVTFASPIYDGPGADFAVFENAFIDPANDSQAFLELGFVEVSTDGTNYVRFPATSLTQADVQVTNDNYMYANNINNLAGKYLARYGTPFDLQELADSPGIDVNSINYVRIVDVIGSVNGHSSYDNAGRVINDPYPTPFATGGFDLDAVGVINQVGSNGVVKVTQNVSVETYPNPVTDKLIISISGVVPTGMYAVLTDIMGRDVLQYALTQNVNEIAVARLPPAMYYLVLHDADGNRCVEKVVKN